MKISRIQIENFRNFHALDIAIGRSAVIVGENQVGKSNLIYAMRLVLDPSLPDSSRQLRAEDFWDGIPRPLTKDTRIRIAIDIADFESNEAHLAVLAEHIVQPEPMVARLTYEFAPILGLEHNPTKDSDFEFVTYGGDRPENRVGYEVRKRIPMEVLHALRDAEGDLARWTKSPLRPLIDRAKADIVPAELAGLADDVSAATDKVAGLKPISDLAVRINEKLKEMAGSNQAMETSLGFSPSDPEKLLRALRILLDGKKRDISEASLGAANVLYLALRSLELDSLVNDGNREHTFFGIEEPEAHLHPHLQRVVYRNYLRQGQQVVHEGAKTDCVTHLLTTHSPHIASVTPVGSLILLRRDAAKKETVGISGEAIALTSTERDDIERYLDVSRAEGLFSRGILLVEGDAEKFIVPVLAARAGYDLDALGITVCSVSGTNFAPYVKFFGPQGLRLPIAVLTDLDPCIAKDDSVRNYGAIRAHALMPLINPALPIPPAPQPAAFYEPHGIFINRSTLEVELNDSGCIYAMDTAMQALCDVQAAKTRFQKIAADTRAVDRIIPLHDPKRFVCDIEYVGKGRFAQRLASEISKIDPKFNVCPPYILKAVKHVLQ